jgi:hypothetical protein
MGAFEEIVWQRLESSVEGGDGLWAEDVDV